MDKPVFFPDHIGWAAARFSHAWNTQFHAEMRAAGYDWAGEARAAILAHLPPGGLAQAELTRRIGLTKQAVQQHVDGLVAIDPDDLLPQQHHPLVCSAIINCSDDHSSAQPFGRKNSSECRAM